APAPPPCRPPARMAKLRITECRRNPSLLLGLGRLGLRLALIERDGGAHQSLQRALIDLVALEEVDRPSLVAFEARIEELVGIRQARAVVEGALPLPLVRVGDGDDAVARPHRASHPLPLLDDLPV